MAKDRRPLRLLRLVNNGGHTSAPYNQFTLPMLDDQAITLGILLSAQQELDRRLHYFEAHGRLFSFLSQLRITLASERFDIVHAHTVHTGFLLVVAALLDCPSLLRRSVLTIHTSFHLLCKRNKFLLFFCFLAFGKIVCCSRSSLESLPQLWRYLGGARLTCIQNGLNLARVAKVRHSLPKAPLASNGDFLIVSVGHLNPGKNPHSVLQSFARCDIPGASLTFLGAGDLLEPLQEEARDLGCADRVKFTGLVAREEALRHMIEADLFVSASRGEGLPVAVIEAMACECCLVLSDIPPHREVSQGLDFIPFVGGDDVAGLARAITRIAQAPAEQRQAWTHRIRQHCEQSFSLERMMAEYNDLFHQLSFTEEFGSNRRYLDKEH